MLPISHKLALSDDAVNSFWKGAIAKRPDRMGGVTRAGNTWLQGSGDE